MGPEGKYTDEQFKSDLETFRVIDFISFYF